MKFNVFSVPMPRPHFVVGGGRFLFEENNQNISEVHGEENILIIVSDFYYIFLHCQNIIIIIIVIIVLAEMTKYWEEWSVGVKIKVLGGMECWSEDHLLQMIG